MARKSLFSNRDVEVRRKTRLREMLEDYGQASALAQSGLPGQAREMFSSHVRKILVVSRNAVFPETLRRNALNLAERLNSGIVAVNLCEAAGHGHEAEIMVRFSTKAKRQARQFENEAKAAGLEFSHAVFEGEADAVVEKLCGELKRVEFVLTVKPQQWEKNLRLSMRVFEVAC